MAFVIIVTICAMFFILLCAMPTRAAVSAGAYSGKRADAEEPRDTLRIATYNIHGAKGTDGVRDLTRIAAEIGNSDIVAVQEVRVGWRTSQIRDLANMLSMAWLYAPALRRWCKNYRGNGLLSRLPVLGWETYPLPNVAGHRYRVYTVAEVAVGKRVLSVLFTHLHTGMGRQQQLNIVMEQFGRLPLPAVLLGDLNTRPADPFLGKHEVGHMDALAGLAGVNRDPDRVDWILTRGLGIVDSGSVDTGASDHPCYWVEVSIAESTPVVDPPAR